MIINITIYSSLIKPAPIKDLTMESSKLLFIFPLSLNLAAGVFSFGFTFKNNCPYTIWPGALTGGSLPQLPITGFSLLPRTSQTLDIPPKWSGRFWARTQCSNDTTGKFTCLTGDCASNQVQCNGAGGIPPATLLEFTLGGANNLDFFDVSLVDGYNLPASIIPQGVGCNSTSCARDVNEICPPEMSVKGGLNSSVVACKSACEAFRNPLYCCAKPYDTPDTCPPSSYSKMFKEMCPQAYSYAYDDKTSTFTCPMGGDYLITFCPSSSSPSF